MAMFITSQEKNPTFLRIGLSTLKKRENVLNSTQLYTHVLHFGKSETRQTTTHYIYI